MDNQESPLSQLPQPSDQGPKAPAPQPFEDPNILRNQPVGIPSGYTYPLTTPHENKPQGSFFKSVRSWIENIFSTYDDINPPLVIEVPPCLFCEKTHFPIPRRCPDTGHELPDTVLCPRCKSLNWKTLHTCRKCAGDLKV
jgi:hypothetical protein